MVKLCRIIIIGKVQGVNFRFFTKAKADELGVCGIVKNIDDGTVYIEAEGEEEELKKFTKWCKTGSPWAKVDDVKIEFVDIFINYKNFTIKH